MLGGAAEELWNQTGRLGGGGYDGPQLVEEVWSEDQGVQQAVYYAEVLNTGDIGTGVD